MNERAEILMLSDHAELIDGELSKRWYGRRQSELASLYETRREASQIQDARISAHIAAAVYVIFSCTDVILINDVSFYSVLARFIIGMIFVIRTEMLFKFGASSVLLERHCAAATVVAFVAWLCIASTTVHQETFSHYFTYGIVFMLGQNVFFNFRFTIAAISSAIIFLVSQTYLLYFYSSNDHFVIAVGVLFLSTFILTLFVNWKLNEERYLVFLNSVYAEIRQNEAIDRGAALLRLSTTDALTGLANRRAVDEALRVLWKDWQTTANSFAVILVDVDYFKMYNDHYGHQEGDRCLVAIANAMSKSIAEPHYTLGRFGGEEFILLLHSPTREHIANVAEDVRRAIEELQIAHSHRPDQSFVVTVSVGVALSRDVPGAKVERLITEADRALYNAKNANRNCVRIFDREDPNQLDLDESVIDLVRTALSQDRLSLVYQPIRHGQVRKVVAAEALMRLTTPSGKSVSPAVFIPLAERTGGILPMGLWAIRTACREVLVENLVPLVSVNVSAVQLSSRGFSLSVASILGEMGVDPRRLAIEVTEGLQIEGQAEIVQSLRELRDFGVRIWLDDFGTGFAGLSCVREIEFDAVKIDRSFLHASSTPKGAEMFKNIVDLVRNTGCETVIEGVETKVQEEIALQHSVDLLQGYFLGKPMSSDVLRQMVTREAAEKPAAMALSA